MTARILGIDPGIASVGWAVATVSPDAATIDDVGVLRTEPTKVKGRTVYADYMARALLLLRELTARVKVHGIDVVLAETALSAQGFRAAFAMGAGVGILAGLQAMHDLPCDVFTPQAVKKLVAGAANATKEQIAEAVARRFPSTAASIRERLGKTVHEHAFDAVAVVMVGLETSELVRLARRRAA